jgi:hypothetical protein
MSFMDKMKSGLDKAREGVTDFAETTRIKHEISKLTDHKNEILGEIGRLVYALHAQGRPVVEVEAQCKEIDGLEQEIKNKGEEIARINTETGAHTTSTQ